MQYTVGVNSDLPAVDLGILQTELDAAVGAGTTCIVGVEGFVNVVKNDPEVNDATIDAVVRNHGTASAALARAKASAKAQVEAFKEKYYASQLGFPGMIEIAQGVFPYNADTQASMKAFCEDACSITTNAIMAIMASESIEELNALMETLRNEYEQFL